MKTGANKVNLDELVGQDFLYEQAVHAENVTEKVMTSKRQLTSIVG